VLCCRVIAASRLSGPVKTQHCGKMTRYWQGVNENERLPRILLIVVCDLFLTSTATVVSKLVRMRIVNVDPLDTSYPVRQVDR
jgi:hypothetical protein